MPPWKGERQIIAVFFFKFPIFAAQLHIIVIISIAYINKGSGIKKFRCTGQDNFAKLGGLFVKCGVRFPPNREAYGDIKNIRLK